jgi:hypothetical protein
MDDDAVRLLIDFCDPLSFELNVQEFFVHLIRLVQPIKNQLITKNDFYKTKQTFSNSSRRSFRFRRHLAAACLFLSRRCVRLKSSSGGSYSKKITCF